MGKCQRGQSSRMTKRIHASCLWTRMAMWTLSLPRGAKVLQGEEGSDRELPTPPPLKEPTDSDAELVAKNVE
eukprot:10281768-Prorocentrum_lima.AAC.1